MTAKEKAWRNRAHDAGLAGRPFPDNVPEKYLPVAHQGYRNGARRLADRRALEGKQ